jgi:glyoxylase-like metal-dependent hydrolase (beta-lactamase superfamily II)
MTSDTIDFTLGAPVEIDTTVTWMDGTGPTEPLVQVHALDEHTFVLRQSLAVHYEGPFVFLLLGNTGALLIDSGATVEPETWPLRATVDRIIDGWLAAHPRESYSLTVAHSHGHGDHTAGDSQFAGRQNTVVVPTDVDGVRDFFGFANWPDETVTYDLGGRVVRVIGGPGHEEAATIFYDPWTAVLFTGDTVYPGRLYVVDMPQFLATIERALAVVASVPVRYLMGCHIEMSALPGQDHPLGSNAHPGEPPLAMLPDQLVRLHERAQSIAGIPGVHGYDDVIIYNGKETVDGFLRPA